MFRRPKNTTFVSEMFFGHGSDTLSTRGNTATTARSRENYHNSLKRTSGNPEKLPENKTNRERSEPRRRPSKDCTMRIAGGEGSGVSNKSTPSEYRCWNASGSIAILRETEGVRLKTTHFCDTLVHFDSGVTISAAIRGAFQNHTLLRTAEVMR